MPKFNESNDPSLDPNYNFNEYLDNNKELPIHLGGHYDIANIDTGLFDYLKEKYNVESMIEIGCGLGKQIDYAVSKGVNSLGLDGDYTIARSNNNFLICDLTRESPQLEQKYDLAWSVEFVEHLYEEFIPIFLPVFQSANYVVMTHAFPGQKGYHHVNCQQSIYWINVFADYGFEYDPIETREMKKYSTMEFPWIQNGGLFFKKRGL